MQLLSNTLLDLSVSSLISSDTSYDIFLANMKQKYTQANGRRPFGLGSMIAGFDPHSHRPHLYATDPAGTYFEWKANAIGHNSKTVKEYLSKNYTEDLPGKTFRVFFGGRSLNDDIMLD